LQELHVHENQNEALPEDFRRLCCLRRCKAAMNKITVLPAGLEEIETLEELELGHNCIQRLTLPDGGLLMLKNLKKLHLEVSA
jgi:hypothetical protein